MDNGEGVKGGRVSCLSQPSATRVGQLHRTLPQRTPASGKRQRPSFSSHATQFRLQSNSRRADRMQPPTRRTAQVLSPSGVNYPNNLTQPRSALSEFGSLLRRKRTGIAHNTHKCATPAAVTGSAGIFDHTPAESNRPMQESCKTNARPHTLDPRF